MKFLSTLLKLSLSKVRQKSLPYSRLRELEPGVAAQLRFPVFLYILNSHIADTSPPWDHVDTTARVVTDDIWMNWVMGWGVVVGSSYLLDLETWKSQLGSNLDSSALSLPGVFTIFVPTLGRLSFNSV